MNRCTIFTFGLALVAASAQAQVSPERIEKRAECITNEGADLPSPDAPRRPGPPAPVNEECAQAVLDGKSCEGQEGAPERACLVREIAVWDGVLDRLVKISDKPARKASLKGAIAAFRGYRDKSCATFRDIAVNPPPKNAVESCRLTETTRFAQTLYSWFYSP